jgi:pyruvyltransferase
MTLLPSADRSGRSTGGDPERALRAAFFTRVPNVGDRVAPLILRAITGRPANLVTDLRKPHILSVGSLMAWATPASQVWGTGVIDPEGATGRARKQHVHALRGPMSLRVLRRNGIAVGDVPLGDPGYLAPAALNIERSPSAPVHPVGLVAHYLDRGQPILAEMLREPGVVDLDVGETPERFLARMADCAAVISTSLHGLVFAEALGIPNLWVKAGDKLIGGEFKFSDWFATTARPQVRPHVLTDGDSALALAARAELRESLIDVQALTAAFPFERLDELQDDAAGAGERPPAAARGGRPLGGLGALVARIADRLR